MATSMKDDITSLPLVTSAPSAWLNYYHHHKCPRWAFCFKWDELEVKCKNECWYTSQLCGCTLCCHYSCLLSTHPRRANICLDLYDILIEWVRPKYPYCSCIGYISDIYPRTKKAWVWLKKIIFFLKMWIVVFTVHFTNLKPVTDMGQKFSIALRCQHSPNKSLCCIGHVKLQQAAGVILAG